MKEEISKKLTKSDLIIKPPGWVPLVDRFCTIEDE